MPQICDNILSPLLFALDEAVRHAPIANDPDVNRFMECLWRGGFHFRSEPWHYAMPSAAGEEALPQEMLLTLRDNRRAVLSHGPALKALYAAGLHVPVDHFLAGAALVEAENNKWPCISINMTLRSLLAIPQPSQGGGLQDILSRFRPERTVFEILEIEDRESGFNRPHAPLTLTALKGMGYRFALDDLSNTEKDHERLVALSSHADYLKLDGSLIEGWHGGDDGDLIYMLMAIKLLKEKGVCRHQAQIVAEWVRGRREAQALSALGVQLVQGRDLLAADFHPAAAKRQSSAFPARSGWATLPAIPPVAAPGLG